MKQEAWYGSKGRHSEVPQVEARIGMPLQRYFEEAAARGLSVRQMGHDLGHSRQWVSRHLRRLGWRHRWVRL